MAIFAEVFCFFSSFADSKVWVESPGPRGRRRESRGKKQLPVRITAIETEESSPNLPDSWRCCGAYRVRTAATREDLKAVFRLRFLVFNRELGEGLESAYQCRYDTDKFDEICNPLIVEHAASGGS